MHRAAFVAMIALLLTGAATAEPWQPQEFMISLWGCPHTPELARAVADAGFNTVMCGPDQLDLCHEHGLRVIVKGVTPEDARRLRDHPAVWGWFVEDEPKEPPSVADEVAAFHEADPTHPAYVNLMAWQDLSAYIAAVQPRVLSYDYYQWWWNEAHHFSRLEVHRRAALEAGIPLICWIEGSSDPRWEWGEKGQTRLFDNPDKLRHSVYTALAYGVKGIQWFNDYVVFRHAAGRRMLPELRPAGEDVAALNREVATLGPQLLGLRSTAVYHAPPLPTGTRAAPDGHWLQPIGGDWVVGHFVDETEREHAMVVNRDYERQRMMIVRVAADHLPVERFDLTRATWVPCPAVDGLDVRLVRLPLRPGEGALLRFSRG